MCALHKPLMLRFLYLISLLFICLSSKASLESKLKNHSLHERERLQAKLHKITVNGFYSDRIKERYSAQSESMQLFNCEWTTIASNGQSYSVDETFVVGQDCSAKELILSIREDYDQIFAFRSIYMYNSDVYSKDECYYCEWHTEIDGIMVRLILGCRSENLGNYNARMLNKSSVDWFNTIDDYP